MNGDEEEGIIAIFIVIIVIISNGTNMMLTPARFCETPHEM